jgi:hypothetical protein
MFHALDANLRRRWTIKSRTLVAFSDANRGSIAPSVRSGAVAMQELRESARSLRWVDGSKPLYSRGAVQFL